MTDLKASAAQEPLAGTELEEGIDLEEELDILESDLVRATSAIDSILRDPSLYDRIRASLVEIGIDGSNDYFLETILEIVERHHAETVRDTINARVAEEVQSNPKAHASICLNPYTRSCIDTFKIKLNGKILPQDVLPKSVDDNWFALLPNFELSFD